MNGKSLAEKIKNDLKKEIKILKEEYHKIPGVAFIAMGDDPASHIYVKSKTKGCKELGIKNSTYFLPENSSEETLINLIENLNMDKNIHGILVEMPLPVHISPRKVVDAIDTNKDVDGVKADNLGKLLLGEPTIAPCTPKGVIKLLEHYNVDMYGRDVVVIGKSNIVGKPLTVMFLNRDATVTTCSEPTVDLKEKTKKADIIVVATGVPNLITGDMVKDGVVIVDVGINRTENGICGDVEFSTVSHKAKYITPVPGGVGPMTVAMLFSNLIENFKKTL